MRNLNVLRALGIFALLLLVGRVAGVAAERKFALLNKTGFEISEIYVSPADADLWEDDILAQDSLPEGKSADLHFETKTEAPKFDFKVVDVDGNEIVWKSVNLSKANKVTLHFENKKPTAELE